MLSPMFVLLSFAIYKGIKLGYTIAKFFLGALGSLSILYACSEFAYEDAYLAKTPYLYVIMANASVLVIVIFLYYCLKEHSRLRGLK